MGGGRTGPEHAPATLEARSSGLYQYIEYEMSICGYAYLVSTVVSTRCAEPIAGPTGRKAANRAARVCACACACMSVRVCVCVCVWEGVGGLGGVTRAGMCAGVGSLYGCAVRACAWRAAGGCIERRDGAPTNGPTGGGLTASVC